MPNTINAYNNAISFDNALYGASGQVENPTLSDSNLFLKLLSSSLTNQDPLNPTDGNEFIEQMTQYATIETLTSVNSTVSTLVNLQMSMNMYTVLNSASSLVNKNVELIPPATEAEPNPSKITGIVDKVVIENDGIYLSVNGEKYEYSSITAVLS